MNFEAWCKERFGIVAFTEGAIGNYMFFGAIPNTQLNLSDIAIYYGCYPYNQFNMTGIIINVDNYKALSYSLHEQFLNNFQGTWESFIAHFFQQMGIDTNNSLEYKMIPPIHLSFKDGHSQQNFCNQFARFNPQVSSNASTTGSTVEISRHLLSNLKDMYYQEQGYRLTSMVDMDKQIASLEKVKGVISGKHLNTRLHQAHLLSLDYTNSQDIKIYESSSAYGLSLKVYAEINRDNLSNPQYQALCYIANLLADFDDQGVLRQSLKTDAHFVDFLRVMYYTKFGPTDTVRPLVRQGETIANWINTNTYNILHGNPKVGLGEEHSFAMKRFLPDNNMASETDELIFQGGKILNHSAIFRIIKIGIHENGRPSEHNEKPHHYLYFKVEHNSGFGCFEPNADETVCTGTYITQLQPFIFNNGTLIYYPINPFTNPQQYQQAMETTLSELIKTERYLILYRTAQDCASADCDEAKEWDYLQQMNALLSGQRYDKPITYYAKKDNIILVFTLQNQRTYMQKGGSCTIFSIRSVVSASLGSNATLHNHFFQSHNDEGHLRAIDTKLNSLRGLLHQRSHVGYAQAFEAGYWESAFKAYTKDKRSTVLFKTLINSQEVSVHILDERLHLVWNNFKNMCERNNKPVVIAKGKVKQEIEEFRKYYKELPRTGIIKGINVSAATHNPSCDEIQFSSAALAYLYQQFKNKPSYYSSLTNLFGQGASTTKATNTSAAKNAPGS